MSTAPTTKRAMDAATAALAAAHLAAVFNEYGTCTAAGFAIGRGPKDWARVHHQQPPIDLTDPGRPSSTARREEQTHQVAAYAGTLEAAGFTVVRHTVLTGPILLTEPPSAPRTPTAYVAYAYSKRQGPNSRGQYHAVLDQDFQAGRYRREAGDTLCPKRSGFWGLEGRLEMAAPSCPGCLEAAERHGITIRTEAGQ